jgi:hypothetical protein
MVVHNAGRGHGDGSRYRVTIWPCVLAAVTISKECWTHVPSAKAVSGNSVLTVFVLQQPGRCWRRVRAVGFDSPSVHHYDVCEGRAMYTLQENALFGTLLVIHGCIAYLAIDAALWQIRKWKGKE